MTEARSASTMTSTCFVNPAKAGADRRIRILVVDDSAVMRRLISRMLASDPSMDVVGLACDGVDALDKVARLEPDLVTLDVEMPEMDGLEALRLMQNRHPRVRVIMCSSLTERGAAVTIDALLAGASDYVTKQHSSSLSDSNYESLRLDLLAKINHLFRKAVTNLPRPSWNGSSSVAPSSLLSQQTSLPRKLASPEILTIGVSTGGPAALAEIMPAVPADFALPIVIVQHMPPFFTRLLAERLNRISSIAVVEGTDGLILQPGTAVLAPGDFHMRVVRRRAHVEVELNQQVQENSCRPAVDVLFRSVAEAYRGAAIAIVLTGMGQDGLLGVGALKTLGAPVLVQDSTTSVIWGMPGAVANAGLADAVLPLQAIIPEVLRRL